MTGLCTAAAWVLIVWFGSGAPQVVYLSSELACEAAAAAMLVKPPHDLTRPLRYVCSPR